MKADSTAFLGAAIVLGVLYVQLNPDRNVVPGGLDAHAGCYRGAAPHGDLRLRILTEGALEVGGKTVPATIRKSNGRTYLSVRDDNGFIVANGEFRFTGSDRGYLLRHGFDRITIPSDGPDAVMFNKIPCAHP